jgi:hypothetical protein
MSDTQDAGVTLPVALRVAGGIISVVETQAPETAHSRDRNDQLLWLALARGFRCFRSLRDVVQGHQEADDAFILTRALTSTALRSLWIAVPADPDERKRRGRVFTHHSLVEARKQARELEALGMVPEIPSSVLQERIDEFYTTERMPADADIAASPELSSFKPIYAVVYRTGSDSVHFSLFAALQGFDAMGITEDDASLSGRRIRFKDGQPDRSATALLQASVVFVAFLEHSDEILSHGMADDARNVLADEFPSVFTDPPHE